MQLANIDYEKAMLGCVLFDNRILDEYQLTKDFFTDANTIEVWHEIERAKARGSEANILELSYRLPEKSGDICRLTDCMTLSNAGFYFSELLELSRKRGIVSMIQGISHRIDDKLTSQEILEYCDKAMTAIVANAAKGYKHVSECIPELIRNIEQAYNLRGALSGIDTGFDELNVKTNGWQKQHFVVIGARPGAGKTSIALNMASAALRTMKTVGFFSAEMDAPSIIKRMVSDWAKVDYKRINSGMLQSSDMDYITEAAGSIADRSLFINDKPSISLADLAIESRRMKRNENVDIIFVDYLSLITNERRDIPRHEQVAEISRLLKQLARELDIPFIVLSQLTREAQGERPKLSQLRDSGSVEQDADMVILLQNLGFVDDTHAKIKINFIVEKNRNGPTGDIPMEFIPARMHFNEVDEPWNVSEKKK